VVEITIKDIARLANVSSATVSRVINNKADVKDSTRKNILEIIAAHDYQPNAFAQGISSKKSNCIGLVIPYDVNYIMMNSFYDEILRGVLTELNRRGYFLMFLYTRTYDYLINVYKQKRVDGFMIIRLGKFDGPVVTLMNEISAPLVSTSRIESEGELVWVDIDNYNAACLAVEHLISLGHRKIAIIAALDMLESGWQRFRGYQDTLRKHNIPYDERMVEAADASMEMGYAVMNKLFAKKVEPTAVFVAGDAMAIGALKALKENGKKVPDDISVLGFDGIPQAEFTDPPLTTVKQPAYEKGRQAAKLLVDMLENKETVKSMQLGVELIIRDSTSRVKAE
jgi:DNA-binding LacI/PurR family transcriptional regulator